MPQRILAVRLGALGDILHTMPAVATLRASLPQCHLGWLVEPRWAPLLEGNPDIDAVETLDRASLSALLGSARRLRQQRYDIAVDFQGLIKSALAARASGAAQRWGLAAGSAREPLAAKLYTGQASPQAVHIVDRHLELAAALGATHRTIAFRIPPGRPEGSLPDRPYVLAAPLAGWQAKQWPLERYAELARLLEQRHKLALVLNGPPSSSSLLGSVQGTLLHTSGLDGLIHATRRATAVVGVDSGPLHLAAALDKPGVAIFGPTDPARNGPYGNTIKVLRSEQAHTSYKRLDQPDASMLAVSARDVSAALDSLSLS